jgi:hypothetical protein
MYALPFPTLRVPHPFHPPYLPAVAGRMKTAGYHNPALPCARSPIYLLFRAFSRQKRPIFDQFSIKSPNKTRPFAPFRRPASHRSALFPRVHPQVAKTRNSPALGIRFAENYPPSAHN